MQTSVYIKPNSMSTSSCFKQAMTEGLGHITHPGVHVCNLDAIIQAVQKLAYYKITTLLTWRSCTELHLLSTFLSSAFRRKSLNSGDLWRINIKQSTCWPNKRVNVPVCFSGMLSKAGSQNLLRFMYCYMVPPEIDYLNGIWLNKMNTFLFICQ